MADGSDKRYFVLREDDHETGVFTGNYPRQAALKAARRLEPSGEGEDDPRANTTEIRLRERGTDTVHVYGAWAWREDAPGDGPD